MPSSLAFLLVLLTLLWGGSPPNKPLWSSSKFLCKSRRCALSSWHCQSLLVSLAAPPGRNDRLQTAATPWKTTACVRLCVFDVSGTRKMPTAVWNSPLTALIRLNPKSGLRTPGHTLEDARCSRRPTPQCWTHGTAHACVCHVLLKPHVLTFSMPSCHFGRMRNSIVFHSRFGGKREKGDSTESRCHKSTFVLHLCICCH